MEWDWGYLEMGRWLSALLIGVTLGERTPPIILEWFLSLSMHSFPLPS